MPREIQELFPTKKAPEKPGLYFVAVHTFTSNKKVGNNDIQSREYVSHAGVLEWSVGISRVKSFPGLNVSIKLPVLSSFSDSFEWHEPFLLPERFWEAAHKKPGRPAEG